MALLLYQFRHWLQVHHQKALSDHRPMPHPNFLLQYFSMLYRKHWYVYDAKIFLGSFKFFDQCHGSIYINQVVIGKCFPFSCMNSAFPGRHRNG